MSLTNLMLRQSSRKFARDGLNTLLINRRLGCATLPISSRTQSIQLQPSIFTRSPIRKFSTNSENKGSDEASVAEDPTDGQPSVVTSNVEQRQFQAETKRLLNIVAKSIYTDKEVFLRELLSNSSDALEKQKLSELRGEVQPSEGAEALRIEVFTNDKERTITIFDTGLGMSRQEAIDNLGTIARSGSQEFLKKLNEQTGKGGADEVASEDALSSIIGQFGVGFYSSFIVADKVEVFTRQAESPSGGVAWISDGSGEFTISAAENLDFDRGTKIVMKLKPDCREFCQENEVEKIITKFSQFINYPIRLNGQQINSLQAIWYKEKREVTDDEYERFYEEIANTKIPFKYKLHYSTDIPLAIKALLYVPSATQEKPGGMTQERSKVHLYSRKVLIKSDCQELLPSYLRFIRGVVDCEDLPLNISRETYQDSHLISKLRNVLTRRILKMIDDEAKRDPAKYNAWYSQFCAFLTEGAHLDHDNKDAIFKLLRFAADFTDKPGDLISLDDYQKKMLKGQNQVFFATGMNRNAALGTPFYEPFKDIEIPVLVVTSQLDEFCLTATDEFKGLKFVNVEQADMDAIRKQLGLEAPEESVDSNVPEEEISNFCIWLKDTLSAKVKKVQLSKRLKDTPAIAVGQMSSSMLMMMQMLQASGQLNPGQAPEMPSDFTLEINASHPTIVNLNALRKEDPDLAAEISQTFLDQVLLSSNIPVDIQQAAQRNQVLIDKYLDESLSIGDSHDKIIEEASFEPIQMGEPEDKQSDPADDQPGQPTESILKQAKRDVQGSGDSGKKIYREYRATGEEWKDMRKK